MAPMSPVPAARSVSSRMRSFSPAVNVRRLGRSDNSGLAAAGAGTTVGLRPSSVPVPAAVLASITLLGMTTRQFSYALKSKLPGACVSSSLARRVAVVLLTLLGAAGESLGMDRHLKSNTVRTRTHSLFRQGCMLYDLIPNMPEHRLKPLIQRNRSPPHVQGYD